MEMLFLPEGDVSAGELVGYDWTLEIEFEFVEPQIAFEEALRDEDSKKIRRLVESYRHDEDAITEFWRIARDAENGSLVLAYIALSIGVTYGDACFEMVAEV